jgi:hypothetical protein
MVDTIRFKSADITAQNTGTDWLDVSGDDVSFEISISGTMSGTTVHLQRKRSGEAAADARDIESYTALTEKRGEVSGDWQVRLFCKTGNYGSGTATLELNK